MATLGATNTTTQYVMPDGWTAAGVTFTYASATTFTTSSDISSTLFKGTRLRFKQGAGYKYYTVQSAVTTTITVITNTDYTVANAAITDNDYSYQAAPEGWPTWFSYTPSTNITLGSGTLTGRYRSIGNSILANVYFKYNGSTMVGSTTFGIPVAASSTTTHWTGMAYILDSGTAEFTWTARIDASGTGMLFNGNNTAGGVSTTAPMTWANNDVLGASIEYQF